MCFWPLYQLKLKKSEIDSVHDGEQGSQHAQNAFDDDLAIKNMVG